MGRLVVSCEDGPGIVSAISSFLHHRGANIVQSDQDSTNSGSGRFFQRLVFHLPGLGEALARLRREFAADVAARFDMAFRMCDVATPPRVAIFVSRYDHCVLDLLWRWRRRELPIDVVQVVSNHPDLGPDVASFGVPFAHIPVSRRTKPAAEKRQLELLAGRVDLDEGPIIEQDVIRVSHRHSAAELVRLGADIERTVLARAVSRHCQDRVLINGNTTIVF